MNFDYLRDPTQSLLVKDQIAGILREDILSGKLNPGDVIVEGKYAVRLKVAQSSIREALSVLAAQGLVQKDAGRSTRVTKLSVEDIVKMYQVRAVLEGLAARLVAEKKPDLSDFDQIIADMRSAMECKNWKAFNNRDLKFHLLLCERSDNGFLLDHVKRVIIPLFGFVLMRSIGATKDAKRWNKAVEEHRQIVEALRTGNPGYAEEFVVRSIQRFASLNYDILMKQQGIEGSVQGRLG